MKMRLLLVCICFFFFGHGFGNEPSIQEETVVTFHHLNLNGAEIKYTATAGTLLLRDDKGNAKASIFYVAYTKDNEEDVKPRPLTFCFNGGPGAASVWLHMGMLGPKRVELLPDASFNPPPYQIVDNAYSLLDTTDLVFIDPVSTGYSRPAPGEDPKQFYGYEEDIKAVGEFIHRYITRHGRWDSPKFLIGESYGTTRAAGLAGHLFDEYKLYLNGIVLISSILNFQTIDFNENNFLSYIVYLPSYTAAAWYHNKLEPKLQENLYRTLKEVEEFALNDYALALLQGDTLEPQKRESVAAKLAKFTGFSVNEVKNNDLQISLGRFTTELLKPQRKTLGRFDSRFLGYSCNGCGDTFHYDPSAAAIFGAFTAAFMDYVSKDLKWKDEDQYKVLTSLRPWNYGANNSYLNVMDNLREAMTKNPALKVYVGSGLFDLATPYFATAYSYNHLRLAPSLKKNLTIHYFEAGHMMYIHLPSLEKLKEDLVKFYASALERKST